VPQALPSAPPSSVSSGAAPAALKTHAIGQTAEALDYTLTLQEVKTCDGTRIAPKPGNVRLGVKVAIEGRTEREVPVNPFYARLSDRQRDGYAYAATFGGCEPDLKSARVEKGNRISGWITFEIPAKASGLELSYSPYVLGSSEQTVKFSLGR
jgi:hypothetical protein